MSVNLCPILGELAVAPVAAGAAQHDVQSEQTHVRKDVHRHTFGDFLP